MKRRVEEMEAEVKKVSGGASSAATSADAAASEAAQADIDARSIYVGQVEYSTTPEELGKLFSSCGQVSRVTILSDKFTGQPKGFAYVEFASADSVVNAMMLNDTEFKGRVLKVSPKRTNVPGLAQRGRVSNYCNTSMASTSMTLWQASHITMCLLLFANIISVLCLSARCLVVC